jgi:integrase
MEGLAKSEDGDATVPPASALTERLIDGFLLGHRATPALPTGADLRGFAEWCAAVGVELPAVDRAYVEAYTRGLKRAGRARSTVARRLAALAGLYRYAVEEAALPRSPVVGKGARVMLPLAPRTVRAIDAALGGRSNGPLLLSVAGRRAGLGKPIGPHSLRHTMVTLALDTDVPLRDVQDAARPADPRTTRRYDRGRHSLDRHATYQLAAFLAEVAPPT